MLGLPATVTVERGDTVTRGQVVATLESSIEEANLVLACARATNDAAISTHPTLSARSEAANMAA